MSNFLGFSVARRIAQIKGEDLNKVLHYTYGNTMKLFSLG